jgi:hypothetical protein
MASSRVNEEVLDRDKLRVIGLQADLVREGQFSLAGGTGLGLRLGHRLSDDLDWFTPKLTVGETGADPAHDGVFAPHSQ